MKLRTILTMALLLARMASAALIMQPYYGDNRLRFYTDVNPDAAHPDYEVDLAPDVQAAWVAAGTGPNCVITHFVGKVFVSFDFDPTGGVLIYNSSDLYPARTANAPQVIKPGGGAGASSIGMAVHPVTGDLYVATAGAGIYKYTAASNYTVESHFADVGAGGGRVQFVCANLAFDSAGNLWLSTFGLTNDPQSHLLICFKGANASTAYGIRNTATKAYTATSAAGASVAVHLFSAPEGLVFDAGGNLWVCNNNDFAHTNVRPELNADPQVPGESTFCKITGTWLASMLTGAPGDYTVPSAHANVKYIPFGKPGGIIRRGNELFINDQGQHQGPDFTTDGTVWRWDTTLPFNAVNFKVSGIHTTYPGNGSMAFFDFTPPSLAGVNVTMTILPDGVVVKDSLAHIRVIITNTGTQPIPFGFGARCEVSALFSPLAVNSPDVSLIGDGWTTTKPPDTPYGFRNDGFPLLPGQSLPPLVHTIRVPANANTTTEIALCRCANFVLVSQSLVPFAPSKAQPLAPPPLNEINTSASAEFPVATPNAIQQWRIAHFGNANPEGNAADNAAPASDGIPNLMKFALDLDPLHPATLREKMVDVVDGAHFGLDIAKNPAASGLLFIVEQTSNLADSNSWTTNGITLDIDNGTRLKATLSQTMQGLGKGFMRLRVVAP